MKKAISFICLVVCTLIWGTAFIAQATGMDNIGPFTFNSVRFYVGFLAVAPFVFLYERKKIKYQIKNKTNQTPQTTQPNHIQSTNKTQNTKPKHTIFIGLLTHPGYKKVFLRVSHRDLSIPHTIGPKFRLLLKNTFFLDLVSATFFPRFLGLLRPKRYQNTKRKND